MSIRSVFLLASKSNTDIGVSRTWDVLGVANFPWFSTWFLVAPPFLVSPWSTFLLQKMVNFYKTFLLSDKTTHLWVLLSISKIETSNISLRANSKNSSDRRCENTTLESGISKKSVNTSLILAFYDQSEECIQIFSLYPVQTKDKMTQICIFDGNWDQVDAETKKTWQYVFSVYDRLLHMQHSTHLLQLVDKSWHTSTKKPSSLKIWLKFVHRNTFWNTITHLIIQIKNEVLEFFVQ